MLRQITTIFIVISISLVAFINPVKAESVSIQYLDYNQLVSVYNGTKDFIHRANDIVDTVEELVDSVDRVAEKAGVVANKVENVIEIVTVSGTAICIVSSVASTTVLPSAAVILPYCSAVGILDSGNALAVAQNKRTIWNVLRSQPIRKVLRLAF